MEWNNKMLEKQLQDNNPAKFLNDEKKIHKKIYNPRSDVMHQFSACLTLPDDG